MKRKLGPLPLWAWTLIAGGTLGLIWYLRSGSAVGAPSTGTTGPVLDATGAAPTGTGGGGGATDGSTTGASLDDLYAGLMNLDADVVALRAQGLTDDAPAPHTWQGDFADVTGAIDTLRETFGLHTDADVQAAKGKAKAAGVKAGKAAQKKADAAAAKKAAQAAAKRKADQKVAAAQKKSAAKKNQGSGAAGKKQDNTPARRTQAHVTPGAGAARRGDEANLNHAAAPARNVSGGNGQKKRTAKPARR